MDIQLAFFSINFKNVSNVSNWSLYVKDSSRIIVIFEMIIFEKVEIINILNLLKI